MKIPTTTRINRSEGFEYGDFPKSGMCNMPNADGAIDKALGIERIIKLCVDDNLPEPEFVITPRTFTICFRIRDNRKVEDSAIVVDTDTRNSLESVLEFLRRNPSITREEIADEMKISARTASRTLKILVETKQISRVGSRRFGHWEIIGKMPNCINGTMDGTMNGTIKASLDATVDDFTEKSEQKGSLKVDDKVDDKLPKVDDKIGKKTSMKILEMMHETPDISLPRIAEWLDMDTSSIAKQVKKLQEQGRVRRVGSRKTGHWEVSDEG